MQIKLDRPAASLVAAVSVAPMRWSEQEKCRPFASRKLYLGRRGSRRAPKSAAPHACRFGQFARRSSENENLATLFPSSPILRSARSLLADCT